MKNTKEYRVLKIKKYNEELPRDKVMSFLVKIVTLLQLELSGLFMAEFLTTYDKTVSKMALSAALVGFDLLFAYNRFNKENKIDELHTELKIQNAATYEMAENWLKEKIDEIKGKQKKNCILGSAHLVASLSLLLLSSFGKYDVALTSVAMYGLLNFFDAMVKQTTLHDRSNKLQEDLDLDRISDLRK